MSDVEIPIDVNLDDALNITNNVLKGVQDTINRAMVTDIHITYTNINNITFAFLNQVIDDTADSQHMWGELNLHLYQYLIGVVISRALDGYSYIDATNIWKADVIREINYIWDEVGGDQSYYWSIDKRLTEHYTLPRIKNMFDKVKDFRDYIYFYVDSLFDVTEKNTADIVTIFELIENLNDNFSDMVTAVIEPWFDAWFTIWNNFYFSQWIPLVDELDSFMVTYNEFSERVEIAIEKVDKQETDLSELWKLIYTPFSNVYSLKENERKSFDYELHLLKELVIEALALDFPSVRETMIENIDVIMGQKQYEQITEEVYNVRQTTTRR